MSTLTEAQPARPRAAIELIRERVQGPTYHTCVIRSDTYANSAAHITRMISEALADFPGLTLDDIEVVQFGGQRYKRTMGIEFRVHDADLVAGSTSVYTRIPGLEFTM